MISIAFITPDAGQVAGIKEAYRDHAAVDGDDEEYDFTVWVASTYRDVPEAALRADIMIARGLMAAQLKKAHPQVALIEVPVGSEIPTTIHRMIRRHGRLPVGVAGHYNMVYSAHGIAEILDVDIRTYAQHSNDPAEINAVLDRMMAEERRIIVCGVNFFRIASGRDCHPAILGMSRESIWQALSEAKHGAIIKRRERERAEQFRTVLNYAHEGVLATGRDGRITVCNAVASDILQQQPDRVVGLPLDRVAPAGQLGAVLRSAADVNERIVSHQGELLAVNKVSVLLGEDFSGHVVTIKKSSEVQRAESRFRQRLSAKGHVARYRFEDLIGAGPALTEVVEKARNFASVTSNILIVGDTGTGKEMFAQSIHNASDRRRAPFLAINCAALSKSLLESELFGYAEGAFTGAVRGGKAGIFEIAHTGTIFLDEISEIPLDLQGRLLRVIQERQIMRLGDDRITPVDVRIISASNKPLLSEVRANNFRRDLYYRLNVLTLHLPSLNQRGADILRLAAHFIDEYCAAFARPAIALSDAAGGRLLRHRWDGNIRELKNVCECLVVLNKTGIIEEADVAGVLVETAPAPEPPPVESYADELRAFERERIRGALAANPGDRAAAARRLGISKTTLWRRMKTLGIEG
ncbi:MAG: sigma 54-interacting transcriptional regulator [Planctomycetes bacterium]|nr:sigma 54-interacting transcriptional regulator [Planctomycetota bacterium]